MKTFFIKNPTGANLSARIKLDSGAEPINIGNPGATVIEGSVLTTCLAPTNPTMKPAVDFKTECFTLDDMGEYAVMVGDELIPHRFKPDQLPKFFHTSNTAVPITFGLCSDYDCSGALPEVITGGIWGDAKWEVNGELILDITQHPKIAVNQQYETRWHWANKSTDLLHVKITKADLNNGDDGWSFTPDRNPTLNVDFDEGIVEFCLAPAIEEPASYNVLFLENKINATWDAPISKMSMEYNGKLYTAHHSGFTVDLRSLLLSMLPGEWTSADGDVIQPIGTPIGYEDIYAIPRHFKVNDEANGDITISGFADNSLLPNLTFTGDPAVIKFVATPQDGGSGEWVDLITTYSGVDNGGLVGDIHSGVDIKSKGYCKK